MFNREIRVNISNVKELIGLRVNFNVEKSLVGYPNLANIKIYNLSESTRNKIEEENLKIQLFAGYSDVSVPLLFDGDVINVVHLKQNTDWISEIFAGDGSRILGASVVNTTLPAGTSSEQIYNTLVENMSGISKGITEGVKNCLSNKTSLLRALQLTGNVKDWLDKIASNCGFEYSVNEGVIETTATGLPLDDVPPVVINQLSGMISSPERTEIGVNVSNLLLPELKLGRTIRVESVSAKINVGNLYYRKIPPIRNQGVYRIDKLVHSGDNYDNAWETQIQARVF